MNSVTIYTKQKKPKVWSRVVFHISRCSGKIKRKFNPDILYGKLEQEDVDIVMALIEKESGKFAFLRFFYKLEIIVIILSLIVLSFSILYFITFKNTVNGIIFIILFFLLILFYFGFVISCINKRKKSYLKRLYPLFDEINRKLFNMRNLYLMIDRDIRYIYIYIVPPYVEANVLLKNILLNDSNSSEDKEKPLQNNFFNLDNSQNNKIFKNLNNLSNNNNNKTGDVLKINGHFKGLGLLWV